MLPMYKSRLENITPIKVKVMQKVGDELFCAMVDQKEVLNILSYGDYCHRFSPSQISDSTRVGFQLEFRLC